MNQTTSDIKVSTIIPVYDCTYLQDTIISVLQQSHENLEVIIINDNPNEDNHETYMSLMKQDKRIKMLHNEHNLGTSLARNRGIYAATGRYVSFIDQDDIRHDKDKITKQLDVTQHAGSDICVGTNYAIIGANGEQLNVVDLPEHDAQIRSMINMIMPMLQSTLLIPKLSLLNIQGYNPLCKNGTEDHELLLRLGSQLSFYNIQEYTTYYRQHGGCASSKKSFRQNYEEIHNVLATGSIYPNYVRGVILRLLCLGIGAVKPYLSQSTIASVKHYKAKVAALIGNMKTH